MRTHITGPALAVQTCIRRLAAVGVEPVAGDPTLVTWPDAEVSDAEADCHISWWGPARSADEPGSEALVQAACGLMHLHGRDLGGPRRIGIEIASVAAGMLAAQALLAVAIGRSRDVPACDVHTSVLQAGLLQSSHYLAAATCPAEEVPAPAPAPGPPFRTAEGRWFEIETFDAEAWKAFWLQLGAPAADLGAAWTRFRPRYYRGTSSLPHGFHEATATHTLAEAMSAARACRVSLSAVRTYEEVLAAPASGFPVLAPLADGSRHRAASHGAAPAPGSLPLAGIEVVEATSRLQGPLAGLLLQMLGARVTRVETPGGDVGRSVPPLADDTGSFFLCFNRGKATVELDLGTEAGRGELAERAAGADVFLQNWRPGKAAEWGLGPDDLARTNPGLVYVEASGWTPGSPASRLIGTDFLVQAWTGLANALHPAPDPPLPSRVLLTDFMGALVTAEGALAGLYRRERTGAGCRVATCLEAGGMALQAHVLDGLQGGVEEGRSTGRPKWGPLDRPVAARDGLLVLHLDGDGDLGRLAEMCGVESRGRPRAEVEHDVVVRIADEPAASWEGRLQAAGLPCARVATDLQGLTVDPHLAPLFEPLASTCLAPASPWRLER